MTAQDIKERLLSKYKGSKVEVTDLTKTGDHFHVVIQAEVLRGLSRIQSHRQIMDLFSAELKSGEIHAFTITASVP